MCVPSARSAIRTNEVARLEWSERFNWKLGGTEHRVVALIYVLAAGNFMRNVLRKVLCGSFVWNSRVEKGCLLAVQLSLQTDLFAHEPHYESVGKLLDFCGLCEYTMRCKHTMVLPIRKSVDDSMPRPAFSSFFFFLVWKKKKNENKRLGSVVRYYSLHRRLSFDNGLEDDTESSDAVARFLWFFKSNCRSSV